MKLTVSPARASQAGFTLMELMLVLGIIVLLMATVIKMGPVIQKGGKDATARANIVTVGAAIMMYGNKHNGKLPSSLEKLVPNEISDELLMDPYGNKLIYSVPSKRSKEKYDLYSKGFDGLENTADDVGNFESE